MAKVSWRAGEQRRSRLSPASPAPPVAPPRGSELGVVIRAYGKFFDVQVQADSRVLLATIKGSVRRERLRTDLVAVGDRVWVTDVGEDEGQIELVEPRTRVLARLARNTRDIEQVILANPDQVLFLFAAREPIPHRRMLDRFLILAETQKLPALIGVNKMDLDQATDGRSVAEKTFADYVPLYDVHFLSLMTSFGVERLRTALAGKITVVAGPSGVGKSSLLNALDPGHDRTIGSVSDHTGKGRHTTIATQLYQIGPATFVADTPGIRSLALDAVPLEDLAQAFPEFRPFMGECFYSDCTHVHEPGCAIREALAAGTIAPARYESYAALRRGDTIDLAAAENLDGP